MSDWKPLNDVQWMNIVNHDHAYFGWNKEDAIHHAVKATEQKLRELNEDKSQKNTADFDTAWPQIYAEYEQGGLRAVALAAWQFAVESCQQAEPVAWSLRESVLLDDLRKANGAFHRIYNAARIKHARDTARVALRDTGDAIARARVIQQPQDERAAFEAWARPDQVQAKRNEADDYTEPGMSAAWSSWQARATLAKKGGAE